MPNSQYLQTSFASGELSPLLYGRTDLDQYYKGAQEAKNVLVVPQGGLKRRPGTQFIDEPKSAGDRQTTNTPTMPNGGTAANINDGDDSTTATTSSIGTTDDFVIAHYDLQTATEISFVGIRAASFSSGSSALKLQYSANNTDWTTFDTTRTFDTTAKDYFTYVGKSFRYWRLIREGTTSLGTFTLAEFNLFLTTVTIGATTIPSWDADASLHNFSVSDTKKYLVSLTSKTMTIYRVQYFQDDIFSPITYETAKLVDIQTPYSFSTSITKTWREVRTAATENVMLFFHELYPTYRLIYRADDDWEFDIAPFSNVPQYDYDDDDSPIPTAEVQVLTFSHFVAGNTYQLDVEGILSKNITFAGDANSDEQDSTAENLRKNLQDMPNFADSGISVSRTAANTYTITFGGASAGPLELLSGFATGSNNVNSSAAIAVARTTTGVSRKEDIWSSARGYPKLGVFHDGRLYIGGTGSKKQTILASRAGNYLDFYTSQGDDDEGIFITLDSKSSTRIVDLNPDRGLQIFTSGTEFLLKGNTPSTVTAEAQTQHGCSDVPVVSVDGATLFVDSSQKTIRQYLFSFNEDAYQASDISVLSSHLIKKPVDMCILNGTSTEESNWVFIVNNDGSCAVLNTLRSQDINGWTDWADADGQVKSCINVGDFIFTTVKRNGTDTLEQWDFDRMLDSSVKQEGVASDKVIDGLDHLEGKTVTVIGEDTSDGDEGNLVVDSRVLLSSKTVSSGQITVDDDETGYDRYEVGLPFDVSVRPMAPNTNAGTRAGFNVMREKKIVRMNIRMHESAVVYVDGNPVPIRVLGPETVNSLNSNIVPVSGIIEDNNGGNGWGIDVSPVISSPDSMPFHIQAIEYEVSSS